MSKHIPSVTIEDGGSVTAGSTVGGALGARRQGEVITRGPGGRDG